jgi:probable rRNA maturation factor
LKILRINGVKDAALSFAFVGEQRMRSMNRTYLNHDYVTDILTFNLTEGDTLEGEIVICPLVAAKNAGRYGHSVARELTLYLVHGILHLLGYDDHAPKDVARMRAKEEVILKKLYAIS